MTTADQTSPDNILARPYPGLRPFDRQEGHLFFGRAEHIEDMLFRLESTRFLAVVGSSGSGKSSLVRAGLLPALEDGLLEGHPGRWRFAIMRPESAPFRNLADALMHSEVLGLTDESFPQRGFIEAALRRGPMGLIEVLDENAPEADAGPLLLLVDQFEELFRFRKEGGVDESRAFVELLLASVGLSSQKRANQRASERPIYIIITMRSDYIGQASAFPGLPAAINDSQFLTPDLTRQQYAEAVNEPAMVCGGALDRALVNQLLNDLSGERDQLPILQHALMRMWTSASEQPPTLTMADYEALSDEASGARGLAGALSAHCEEVLRRLPEDRQKAAEGVFRALCAAGTGFGDTRRPVSIGTIAAETNLSTDAIMDVIEAFRREGRNFLMPPPRVPLGPETVIDIAHESLIRQWPRLAAWVEDEARSAETYLRIEQQARLWEAGKAELWMGLDIESARQWRDQRRPTRVWASRYGREQGRDFELAMRFLDESERAFEQRQLDELAARDRKLRQRILAVLVAALVLVGIVGVPLWLRYEDQKELHANTIGLLEPLRTEETRSWRVGHSMERVAQYLIFNRKDKDRFDRLKTALDEYQDLLHPGYAMDYSGQDYLRDAGPEAAIVVEYSKRRVQDLAIVDLRNDTYAWETGFRTGWFRYSSWVASRWGIPVPELVHLKQDPNIPPDQIRVSIYGKPFWVTAKFSDAWPVLATQALEGEGKAFFEHFRSEWRSIPADLSNNVTLHAMPTWSRPAWKVITGHDLSPGSDIVALVIVQHLIKNPELLVHEKSVEAMLHVLERKRKIDILEVKAARGDRLVADLRELVRQGTGMKADNLVWVLHGLAAYPKLSSKEAAPLVVDFVNGNTWPQSPLSGPWRSGRSISEERFEAVVKKVDPAYQRAAGQLPWLSRTLELELSKEAWGLREDVLAAWAKVADAFEGRFGIKVATELEVAIDNNLNGFSAQLRSLNQDEDHEDAQQFTLDREAPVEQLMMKLRFALQALRRYLITPEATADIMGGFDVNLLTWLETRYSVTDLVRIQRAVVWPTDEEIDRLATAPESEVIPTPAHHTLEHRDWLFGSLAFWVNVGDPRSLASLQKNLRKTQRARLEPDAFGSVYGQVAAMVAQGIEKLALAEYADAEALFAKAIKKNKNKAVTAFLDQYPKDLKNRQTKSLLKHCSRSLDNFKRPYNRRLFESWTDHKPATEDQERLLSLCYAIFRAGKDPEPLKQLLERYPEASTWTPKEAMWLAYEVLSEDPVLPGQRWRAQGIELTQYAYEKEPKKDKAVNFFFKIKNRCQKPGPKNWCWQLVGNLAERRPQFNVVFEVAFQLIHREPEEDRKLGWQLLEQSEKLLLKEDKKYQARIRPWVKYYFTFASLRAAVMSGDPKQLEQVALGLRQWMKHDNEQLAAEARTNLIQVLGDLGKTDEALALAEPLLDERIQQAESAKWSRKKQIREATVPLVQYMYWATLPAGDPNISVKVLDKAETLIDTMDEFYFLRTLHGVISGSKSPDFRRNARTFLASKHEYRAYVAMLLYAAMGGSKQPAMVLKDEWAAVEPKRPTWPARLRGGDPMAWREMLIGYYQGEVGADETLGVLEDDARFATSDFTNLPMTRQGLLTEARFYDAFLAKVQGDTERYMQRLRQVVDSGNQNYLETRMARFLIQQTNHLN